MQTAPVGKFWDRIRSLLILTRWPAYILVRVDKDLTQLTWFGIWACLDRLHAPYAVVLVEQLYCLS